MDRPRRQRVAESIGLGVPRVAEGIAYAHAARVLMIAGSIKEELRIKEH